MNNDNLYKIGEVARFTSTTIGAIRHYQKVGLISPQVVDQDTGYRYFTHSEIVKIKTINYLRKMDMSLEEIGRILENTTGDILRVIEGKLENLSEEIKRLNLIEKDLQSLRQVYQDQIYDDSLLDGQGDLSVLVKLESFDHIDNYIMDYVTSKYGMDVKQLGLLIDNYKIRGFVELYSARGDYEIAISPKHIEIIGKELLEDRIKNIDRALVLVRFSSALNWYYKVIDY